jgi:hypothetical protein
MIVYEKYYIGYSKASLMNIYSNFDLFIYFNKYTFNIKMIITF